MAFGFVCVHRALDMAGFSLLAPDPGAYAARALLEAGVALAVAVGFLTPAALIVLLALLATSSGQYLGLQIARMLIWGLLLAGAGRHLSVDAAILRRPALARLVGPLYLLAPASPASLGPVRLLLIGLFWTVAFSGVRYHLFDPFWRRADVLQLAFSLPYFSDHHALFAALSRDQPELYDLVCSIGLYVQAFWQAALLPLLFLPFRVARGFAILQGLAFFLASTFLLNLGYLGPFELLLWALVFATAPRCGLDPRLRGQGGPKESGPRLVVLTVGLVVGALFLAENLVAIVDVLAGTQVSRTVALPRPLLVTFGLGRVNVFNEPDIRLGTAHPVIVETDAAGKSMRVVPFLDHEGGRLDYLRNDLLYFGWSLHWQRQPRAVRFKGRDPVRATGETFRLLQRVVDLDVCLTGFATPRYYRAVLMSRDIVRTDGLPRWTEPSEITSVRLEVGEAEATDLRAQLNGAAGLVGCYDLPPGHAGSNRRARETLAWARTLPPLR